MPCKVATYSFILSSQTDIENEFALGVYTCVECFYSLGLTYNISKITNNVSYIMNKLFQGRGQEVCRMFMWTEKEFC